MKKRYRPQWIALAALFLLASTAGFSANITVPTFQLFTHALPYNGVFALQTYGNIIIQVDGGYKFGAQIDLNFLASVSPSNTLEQNTPNPLGFYGASVIMRDVLSSSIDVSYFVGQNDTFCAGDGFSYFGATTFATNYSGFLYFPAGPLYSGIYQVNGTGVRLDVSPLKETLRLSLYAYEDTHQNDLLTMPVDLRIVLVRLTLPGEPRGAQAGGLRGHDVHPYHHVRVVPRRSHAVRDKQGRRVLCAGRGA
jgi:hypothetical protein